MDSSAKIMKATGVIHEIHGSLMGILSIFLLLTALSDVSILGGLLLLALLGGISFLYIYIGYELFSLRNSTKMKNLLIASIILSCMEIIASIVNGEAAGVVFIIEFIMSIIALCNIDSYRKFKEPEGASKKNSSVGTKQVKRIAAHNTEKHDIEDEYYDEYI